MPGRAGPSAYPTATAAADGHHVGGRRWIGDGRDQRRQLLERFALLRQVAVSVVDGIAWQGSLDTYDRAQVARMREVNVEGVINATRAVMGGMRARRYGRIVNVSSIAAIGTALPGNAFYAATKAEVAMLTRRFALELARTISASTPWRQGSCALT